MNKNEILNKNLNFFQCTMSYLFEYLEKTVLDTYFGEDMPKLSSIKLENIELDSIVKVLENKFDDHISIEYAKSNLPIPVFHSGLKAHSSYYPERESEKYTELINQKEKIKVKANSKNQTRTKTIAISSTVEIYGLFFLYHIPAFDRVLILDADETVFFASLLHIDYSEKFKNSKCMIILPSLLNEFESNSKLQDTLFTFYNPNIIDIIQKLYHPLYKKKYSTMLFRYDDFERRYETIVYTMMLRYKTAVFSYKRNCINTMTNINQIKQGKLYRTIKEFQCDKTKASVIIGASPVLDVMQAEIIESIGKDRQNTIVISVDNGVLYCEQNNIKPDVIISLDNRAFVKKMIPETFYEIPFICPLSINPTIFGKMKNPYIFTLEGQPGYQHVPYVNVQVSNVGLLAILIAKIAGLQKIALWGIDFSFTNHKYYYKNTYHYSLLHMISGYVSPTVDCGTKEVLNKNEMKLFSLYKKEFDRLNSASFSYGNGYETVSEELLTAYFKIKGYSEKSSEENVKIIIEGLNVQDQNR